MAKQQKLVPPEEQATMMIPEDKAPAEAPKPAAGLARKRMKVNVSLVSGRAVSAGEFVDLTEEEHEHLKKSFGDSLSHILE